MDHGANRVRLVSDITRGNEHDALKNASLGLFSLEKSRSRLAFVKRMRKKA